MDRRCARNDKSHSRDAHKAMQRKAVALPLHSVISTSRCAFFSRLRLPKSLAQRLWRAAQVGDRRRRYLQLWRDGLHYGHDLRSNSCYTCWSTREEQKYTVWLSRMGSCHCLHQLQRVCYLSFFDSSRLILPPQLVYRGRPAGRLVEYNFQWVDRNTDHLGMGRAL